MIVNNWELSSNFYSINPQLKIFYNKYDKSFESDMLWALSLMIDTESKFVSLPYDDRLTLIASELKVNKKKLDKLVNDIQLDYQNTFESVEIKVLKNWQSKMKERDIFLNDTKYTLGEISDKGAWVGGTADVLDKMLSNTKKLYDDLERIKKDLEKVKDVTSGVAGRERSLSDKREI